MIKLTLIISFYNKIEYLRLILAALEIQTFKEFEIIIADDGSTKQVVKSLEQIIKESPLIIRHIWHEDNGFRKNVILNQAILKSKSEYLVFIDGDCIPHPKFIEEHYSNSQVNVCLTGRRVNLSEKITNILTQQNIMQGYFKSSYWYIIFDGIFGKSFDVEKGFYFKSDIFRNFFNKKKRGILGCNFSLYKKDFLSINGFDERYRYPSIGEDSDVDYRLGLNGVEIKSINNIAVQYHLYHKLQPRMQENLNLFEKVKKDKLAFTPFGIQK